MKTVPNILLAIIFSVSVTNQALAKDESAVLCKMLSSSLSDPWEFDEVIKTQSSHFDSSMLTFIQGQIKQLATQAKQREAECEPYKNKSMGYDICMGNNSARELAGWLKSVLQVSKGSTWQQTEFGSDQLEVWNSCNNPAFCEQLRSAAVRESLLECASWLKGK